MQHLVQLLCMLWLAGCSSSHGTADGDGSQDQNAGSDAGNAGPRDMPQPVEVVDGDQDAGQPSCFAEGTPIATPDGDRAIELLQVGDLVWAFDHDLDRRVARPVIAVHHHASAVVGRLVTGASHALHVTASHPIFAPRQGRYIDAEELSRGVPLLAAGELGEIVVYVEWCLTDLEFGVHEFLAVGRGTSHDLLGAECLLVEFDGSGRIVHDQMRD